ncbi:MAG: hypothetical protein PHO75_02810 [Candidatus Shapirobacteria bacterium]|jgi:hypothetical protein|nr:hypothetical protein [Candidatus Shapirobacteria bacterium]
MSKRIRYLISSLLAAIGFYFFLSLPYESHYYGLLVGVVLVIFCFWFGLGIVFDKSIYIRLMSIVMPVAFFIGFALFATLLPQNFLLTFFYSLFFGLISYAMFLVENVFLVAIGFRTPPLYRAAYTVGLILLLLSSFFLFDSLFSFKFNYWLNMIIVFVISIVIFLYIFFSVTIELPDDGKDKNVWYYIFVPSLLMAEMALVLSFWPVGIFKGSIYLVMIVYVLSSLLHAELRERLFKKTWRVLVWIGVAIILGIVLTGNSIV